MPLNLAIYFILLAATIACGCTQYRRLRVPDKLILLLISATLLTEVLSFVSTKLFENNLILYHIYSPIEFLLISFYFHKSVPLLHRHNIAATTGVAGVVLSVLNSCFVQKLWQINSYFLLFEGTVIIMYSILSFHQILMGERNLPYIYAQFWISASMLIYWSTTFTGWGVYALLEKNEFHLNPIFQTVLQGANYLFYLAIGTTFLRYKKLIPSGE